MKVLYRVLGGLSEKYERKYYMSYKPGEEIVKVTEDQTVQASDPKQEEPPKEASYEYQEPYDTTQEQEPDKAVKSNSKGLIYDLIFYALLIFVCIYILPNFVIQRTIVDGSSMENTLFDGEQLYVEKLSYRFDALNRFDIIVFYPYGRDNEEYYVKRIIGMPGETVQIIGSDIYIDGKLLEEHYGKDPIKEAGRAAEPITLGDDEYFVLGDNRSVSKDSRTEEVGNVKRENIGGRAILRIKPLSKFGLID
jgi:signal peptidase I